MRKRFWFGLLWFWVLLLLFYVYVCFILLFHVLLVLAAYRDNPIDFSWLWIVPIYISTNYWPAASNKEKQLYRSSNENSKDEGYIALAPETK